MFGSKVMCVHAEREIECLFAINVLQEICSQNVKTRDRMRETLNANFRIT
jgi:hypothetical protein